MLLFANALLWVRANPKVVAWGLLSVIAVVIALMVYAMIYSRGANSVWGKVDQQNKEAQDAAAQAGSRVDQCYRRDGMRWDYPRGECVRAEGAAR